MADEVAVGGGGLGEVAAFRVVRRVAVVTYHEEVLLETNDWLEAHAKVTDAMPRVFSADQELPHVTGEHPTHSFDDGICTRCHAIANGSYGSHAPCGTTFTTSLHEMVEDWRRRTSPTHPAHQPRTDRREPEQGADA